jgi:chromosome partitioning protein
VKFPKTQVIALVNQKGGCGKTTSSVSIAAAFARLGYRACLVDTDPQCNATESFGVESETLVAEKKFTVVDAYLKRKPAKDIALAFPPERFHEQLYLVPAVRGLSSVQLKLESELQIMIADGEKTTLDADEIRNEQRNRLRSSIDSLRGIFDVVIIDTPPSLDFLMISALIAADWFVIPVFPSGYDLKGLELLTRTVTKVRDRFNPGIKLAGVLLGNFDRTTVLDKDILILLIRRFGEAAVFRTTIGRSVRMREATVRGLTVFELPEAEPQGEQFLSLVREMINRGTKKGEETLNPLPDDAVLQRIVNG